MLSGTTVTDACRLWVVAFAIPVYGAGSGRAIRGMFAKPTMVYGFGLALICSITCDAMLVAAAFVSDRFAKPIPSMKACRRNTETPANSAMPTSSSTNVKPPSRRAGGIGLRSVCTKCLRARIVFMNESPTLSPACRPARQVSMPRLTGCDSPLRATKSAEAPLKDPALLVTSEPSSATRLTLRVPWLCVPELLRVCLFGRTCRYVVESHYPERPPPCQPPQAFDGWGCRRVRALFARPSGERAGILTPPSPPLTGILNSRRALGNALLGDRLRGHTEPQALLDGGRDRGADGGGIEAGPEHQADPRLVERPRAGHHDLIAHDAGDGQHDAVGFAGVHEQAADLHRVPDTSENPRQPRRGAPARTCAGRPGGKIAGAQPEQAIGGVEEGDHHLPGAPRGRLFARLRIEQLDRDAIGQVQPLRRGALVGDEAHIRCGVGLADPHAEPLSRALPLRGRQVLPHDAR